MERLKLKVENRPQELKGHQLRKKGTIPAVIYNHGKTDHVQVNAKEVSKLFAHGVSESVLIDLLHDGKEDTVFVKDYQIHPVTDEVLHLDFYRITFGEKIKTHIGLHIEGKPVGVKEGGILEVFLQEVEIETFPKYLTAALNVDVTNLKIGDALHISDLQLPPETKIMLDPGTVICHIARPAKLTAAETEEAAAEEEEK
ncbi:MAG: 50S ribosomal protein L25 [Leptospiraceae bacterium]|nr:50S ribosomal protein L25 [Leptospiraceae bacterium]